MKDLDILPNSVFEVKNSDRIFCCCRCSFFLVVAFDLQILDFPVCVCIYMYVHTGFYFVLFSVALVCDKAEVYFCQAYFNYVSHWKVSEV